MTRLMYLLGAIVLLVGGGAVAAYAGNEHPSDGCKYKCGPPPTNPPPTSPPPTTPPPGHTCTYTGAGKDGQPGNDDCAAVPPKTTTTPPTDPPVTQTVTVTVPTPPTVITKTVVKYKDRVVYRTKYKNKIIKKTIILRRTCGCPPGTKLWHGKCHPKVPAKG